ncbi:hypothetical protein QJS04_geneDACA023175 [Acorus gramineus]|uniref:Uncharacterized protein n=1 Tax=Acorus gramineus TaxID=55184 RepID=A0AAV9BVT9_ACOGR|nr:hypothetical protein QJS04_geneDACA023175 [Acorus gramineus]
MNKVAAQHQLRFGVSLSGSHGERSDASERLYFGVRLLGFAHPHHPHSHFLVGFCKTKLSFSSDQRTKQYRNQRETNDGFINERWVTEEFECTSTGPGSSTGPMETEKVMQRIWKGIVIE